MGRVSQCQRSSCGIHTSSTRGRLLRHLVKSYKLRGSMKSQSAHMDYRAFCKAAVHSARSSLVAHHPPPLACTSFSQRLATPSLPVPGLPFSSDSRHTKVLGTYPKPKAPGQLKLPQQGCSSAPDILSTMVTDERCSSLRYHPHHLPAHSGSSRSQGEIFTYLCDIYPEQCHLLHPGLRGKYRSQRSAWHRHFSTKLLSA